MQGGSTSPTPSWRKTVATIRIVVADDHAVLRAGLRMLIEAQPDMEVVGQAANRYEALQQGTTAETGCLNARAQHAGGQWRQDNRADSKRKAPEESARSDRIKLPSK